MPFSTNTITLADISGNTTNTNTTGTIYIDNNPSFSSIFILDVSASSNTVYVNAIKPSFGSLTEGRIVTFINRSSNKTGVSFKTDTLSPPDIFDGLLIGANTLINYFGTATFMYFNNLTLGLPSTGTGIDGSWVLTSSTPGN